MVYHLSVARANRADRIRQTAAARPANSLRDRPLRAIWRLNPVTSRPEMFWTYDTGVAAQGRASECL